MFTADFIIDSVQSAKKTVVNTFIVNESVKKDLIKLIDTQTDFVKGSFKNSLAIAESLLKNSTSVFYPTK